MLTKKDETDIIARGSHPAVVEQQMSHFRKGFPFLRVVEAASAGKGILRLSESETLRYVSAYDEAITSGLTILKFVPASGAASRMFKSLFSALEALKKGESEASVLAGNKETREFYGNIGKLVFYERLKACMDRDHAALTLGNALEYLLTAKGMDYGSLPKGMLLFHRYSDRCRTPFEEHLVEGANYARDKDGIVKLHFTVSPEHEHGFRNLLAAAREEYGQLFGVTYEVSFSHQKPSTDTIAVDPGNNPFRDNDGSIVFRPGGHGALLDNLNDLESDLVFIKNIDNVVPDRLKEPTYTFKKALAGVLLHYQTHIFRFQKLLNERHPSAIDSALLAEAANYLQHELNTLPAEDQYYTEREDLYHYLKAKYNRPIRVCGMVRNEGEPGGGPFWARNSDGTVSLQIAESVQIDPADPVQQKILGNATHFNPVDLVCGIKNYRGEKFNLPDFRDPDTGFISHKSKDGRDLKAQELPGLWNGAMSDWNTLFVEVPAETFHPVKTVNDLLRDPHQ